MSRSHCDTPIPSVTDHSGPTPHGDGARTAVDGNPRVQRSPGAASVRPERPRQPCPEVPIGSRRARRQQNLMTEAIPAISEYTAKGNRVRVWK